MTQEELDKFYSKVSFAGLLAILTLKLSLEKKIAFNRETFAKESYISSLDYFHGFVVACSSLGAINYNVRDSIMTMIDMDPLLYNSIEKEIENKTKDNETWKALSDRIFSYFN